MKNTCHPYRILGLVLSGGLSTRMGRDKADIQLSGKTLLQHAISLLQNITDDVAVSSNKPFEVAKRLDFPYLADLPQSQQKGPLSGIVAGLNYAAQHRYDAVLTIPVDTPFLDRTILQTMLVDFNKNKTLRLAITPDGLQPTIGLWAVNLYDKLAKHLQSTSNKSIRFFATENHAQLVSFHQAEQQLAFMNINTPQELALAQNILQSLKGSSHET